jgi:cysteine desulfurase
VSHGSACQARVIEPSRVLLAMGASREAALNSIRVSLGPSNTAEEVDGFLRALSGILEQKGRAS